MNREFVLCDTLDAVTRMSSELIQRLCAEAILDRGSASLAISGGSTPQALFKLWQAETFPGLAPRHVDIENGGDDAGEEAYCYAGQAGKGLLSIVYCRG